MRRIDGRKRYFSRSVGNLILLAPELEGLRRIDSSEIGFRERHAARVIAATDSLGMCTNPVTMTITRSDQNKEDKTMSEREKNEKSTVRPMKRTRKKVCAFCADRAEFIDYKDVAKLRKCMTERYKILPRRVTGCCAYHQRELTTAIKKARQVALIPYVSD